MGRKAKQRDYKLYNQKIYEYFTVNFKMPSFEELKEVFGVESKDTVSRIINDMVNMGYVNKDDKGKILPTNEGLLEVLKNKKKETKTKLDS